MTSHGSDSLDRKKVHVIFYGVGAIGTEAVKYALTKKWLQIVGAIDVDRSKVGLDLGEAIGLGHNIGTKVSNDPSSVFNQVKADIVVFTTGSFFKSIYDQLEMTARAGINIITSAEELAFPTLQSPDLAKALDAVARENGITVMAAGINPGFVMDTLIVYLATACSDVASVRARRIVNISLRRKQLQLKVGAGLSIKEFKENLGKTILGHIGLLESAALVADGLDMKPDNISQWIEPMIAETAISSEYLSVNVGEVMGMRQIARCFKGDEECVNLEVQFYLGAPDQRDEILIEGKSRIDVTIKDGIFGDPATVAILINSIPSVVKATPGLLTPTGKGVSDIMWQCSFDCGY